MPGQVGGSGSLGDLPLAVLTASRYELPPGLPEALAASLREVRLALQRELAALSMRSTHVVAEQSGHDIQVDQPDLVIDAIRGLVEASRASPLGPVYEPTTIPTSLGHLVGTGGHRIPRCADQHAPHDPPGHGSGRRTCRHAPQSAVYDRTGVRA